MCRECSISRIWGKKKEESIWETFFLGNPNPLAYRPALEGLGPQCARGRVRSREREADQPSNPTHSFYLLLLVGGSGSSRLPATLLCILSCEGCESGELALHLLSSTNLVCFWISTLSLPPCFFHFPLGFLASPLSYVLQIMPASHWWILMAIYKGPLYSFLFLLFSTNSIAECDGGSQGTIRTHKHEQCGQAPRENSMNDRLQIQHKGARRASQELSCEEE